MYSAPAPPRYICPVPRYGFHEEGTFARDTILKRWPVIIKDTASAVTSALSTPEYSSSPEAVSQGKEIVRQIKDLLMTISKDEEFQYVAEDGGSNIASYNEMIDELRKEGIKTWYDLPWLFAECLLYRTLRTYFALQPRWNSFDPYFSSKVSTFKSSSHAVIDLSKSLLALPASLSTDLALLQPIFHTYTQTALWGNATDLSMLAGAGGLTEEALRELQKRGKEEEKFILRNDEGKVWDWLVAKEKDEKGGRRRCDIVLDNAGFELFTDMIYADFLLTSTPFFDEVVFHPKTIPWFVSDVLPVDFNWIISTLLSPTSFFTSSLSPEDASSLRSLGERFQAHVESGKFKLSTDLALGRTLPAGDASSVDFWTNGCEYQRMVEHGLEGAEETLKRLEGSGLVVFKGDLNYRKLTCDAKWKSDTPFEEVLGPLNGKFPILSLRTNKAEVIVGLDSGLEEKIEKEDPKWRVNGKWAVVSFAPAREEQRATPAR